MPLPNQFQQKLCEGFALESALSQSSEWEFRSRLDSYTLHQTAALTLDADTSSCWEVVEWILDSNFDYASYEVYNANSLMGKSAKRNVEDATLLAYPPEGRSNVTELR